MWMVDKSRKFGYSTMHHTEPIHMDISQFEARPIALDRFQAGCINQAYISTQSSPLTQSISQPDSIGFLAKPHWTL